MLNITDTARDALLTNALNSASRQIDQMCGRRFYLDTETSQRIYSPLKREHWYVDGGGIMLDDIGSVTGLIFEEGYQGYTGAPTGTWTDISNDFVLMPDNALAIGQPITAARRAIGVIQDPYILLRVTALWGWPYVPDDIIQAAYIQAARLYRRKDSPEGILGSSEWGAARVSRVDPDVQALTDPYRRGGFA
jgi:hypothetical protein